MRYFVRLLENKRRCDLDEIEIIPEYKKALELAVCGCLAVFVTGKAGTGKSTMIRFLSTALPNCVILAPTAAAAINAGGGTIHSFFGFPARHIDPSEKLRLTPKSKAVIEKMDALIIDEASMVTPNLVDAMDILLRRTRKSKEPFGGISVVFVGDLLQLPPVLASAEEKAYFSHRYESPFFYSADVFSRCEIAAVNLTQVRRQEDAGFIEALGFVREGVRLDDAIRYFNSNCLKSPSTLDNPIWLVSTNASAHAINSKRLAGLGGETREYTAITEGGDPASKWRLAVPELLELKVGARVVFLRNNKPKGWINGDTGEVLAFGTQSLVVKSAASGEILDVGRMSWERYAYTYDEKNKKIDKEVVGSFEQFPVSLGWAVTIHKAQGMTLECAVVDLGYGSFCDGQSYVALSRCRSVEGLRIARTFSQKDVKVNAQALEFYRSIGIG
jgi:ATP-dependent DNA helicase PIF1